MFQPKLFSYDEPLSKPAHGKTYTLDNVPMNLLTASEWLTDGFIIEGDPQAWVWTKKEGYVGLYSSRKVKPKPVDKVIHLPAIRKDIEDTVQQLADIQRDIVQCKADVQTALEMKRESDSPIMGKFLAFCIGLHLQRLDEEKALQAKLKALKAKR